MTAPRRPPSGVLERALEQLAPEAGRLVLGVDDEQREAPQPVAVDRERRAGQLAVALGDPGAAGVAVDAAG